jgi:hypothetical protein
MIKIWYSDIDWENIDGQVVKMSIGNEMYINSRFTYNYTPPVITEDTWNGKTFPVQINIWDSYVIEFATKEQSINTIAKIQACENIIVEDCETNEIIKVDTSTSSGLSVEPGDRFMTANMGFNFVFKSKKTPIYPGIARYNTNTLQIVIDGNTYNYYSDKDLINFITDAEQSKYNNGIGYDSTSKTACKYGVRMVFYLMESEAIILKGHVENLGQTSWSATINPLTDNITSIEIGVCKLTALTEGLYRCEVEFITDYNTNYA